MTVSASHREEFYQVISSHPHDLEEIEPYIETAYQNGRLWVVKVSSDAPLSAMKHLRSLKGGERSYIHKPIFSSSQKLKVPSPIRLLVDQVDKENIERDVEELSYFRTRLAGTMDNQEAVNLMAVRFADMGYEVYQQCYRINSCNVVAEKKGNVQPQEVLMVMGHIDSVGKDFAGADDNASGTAVLMEMARILKNYSNKKTIRFLITNSEELGLIGATYYARKLEDEDKLKELSLVINMDMVGYNKNGIVEIETDPEFQDMAKWYGELAATYTKLKSKITLGAWGSDHVVFLKRGVPALLTIENWDTKTPCYHLECDKPSTLNYVYAAEIGKLNLSAILSKDQF